MDEESKKKNNELTDDEANSVAGGRGNLDFVTCPKCSAMITRYCGRGVCSCGYVSTW